MRLPIRLLLFICLLGFWISACNLSETPQPDTLTFHLDDSLKEASGKYDSVRLVLCTVKGRDTLSVKTLFHGKYTDSGQLRNLSLGGNFDGNFIVRVIAYRNGAPVLDVGVPFYKGEMAEPIVYRTPAADSSTQHAPYFLSGLEDVSLEERESRRIILKARDTDGDPIRFQILNLDSMRALFPDEAIDVKTGADSLLLEFSPGSVQGIFRFRIALLDPFLPSVIQTLTISVGAVNRPPSIIIQGPGTGTSFLVKEGENLSLRISAQDADSGDHAVLLPLLSPPWPGCGIGEYDTASGELFFTPSFQCVTEGETTFSDWIFRAADNGVPSEQGQRAIRITVRDSNSAPRWKSNSISLSGKEGQSIDRDLSGIYIGDSENDPVEFSASCGLVDEKTLHWTFTPGYRDAGSMDCEILAKDSHHPPATSKLVLKLNIADSIRQVDVAIVSPSRGSATRDSLVIVKWKIGDQWQTRDTLEILHNEGPNIIHRSYKDSSGQFGSDSILVIRDTEPPLAPLLAADSISLTNNPRPTWSWKSGGRGGSGLFRYKLEDTIWAEAGLQGKASTFTPSSDLSEGVHVLYVEERDSAGNWSRAAHFQIETDFTPPNIPILTSTGFHTLNPRPTWQWSTGGNGGSGVFRYKLDDPILASSSIESTVNSFAPSLSFVVGTRHTLYVQERDKAGNWSESASYQIWIHGLVGYGVSGAGLIKTENGGKSWDTLSRPSKLSLNSVWFTDSYNGIVAGDSGTIFRTDDGGQNWQKTSTGTVSQLNTIFFLSRDIAFVGSSDGLIAKSADRGISWVQAHSKREMGIFSIQFWNGATGLAVGTGHSGLRGNVSITSDSGKTWIEPVEETNYGLFSAYLIDSKTMICVGQKGSIIRTIDGGRTWNEMNSGTTAFLRSVFFLSPSTGFASGEGGTLLKTVDGGKNWTPVSVNYPYELGHMFFLDEKNGIVAGNVGEVLRTEDGGISWYRVNFPPWVDYPLSQYPDIPMYTMPSCSQIFFP